jgi:hypothetical protein
VLGHAQSGVVHKVLRRLAAADAARHERDQRVVVLWEGSERQGGRHGAATVGVMQTITILDFDCMGMTPYTAITCMF